MPQDLKVHLYKRGCIHVYWYWTSDGGVEPNGGVNVHRSSNIQVSHNDYNMADKFQTMVDDIIRARQDDKCEPPIKTSSNFMKSSI